MRCATLVRVTLRIACAAVFFSFYSPRFIASAQDSLDVAVDLPDDFTYPLEFSVNPTLVAPITGPSLPFVPLVSAPDAKSSAEESSKENAPGAASDPSSGIKPQQQKKGGDKSTRFRWWPATGESLLYTGIMHGFDLASQTSTRDALNGHWFTHYAQSVEALHGWTDGDKFMAPYAGHPIEGSAFGYIQRQNDPKYKLVQWGDGREYWISLLRSMAFGAVWHTQWKIGPVSEASIANVMLHAPPGFITLVDTPTLGFVTMVAEDVADRYVIMDIENRTTNRAVIMLARTFLNPGRTVANSMAFKVPWARDTRMGLFGENYDQRKQLLADYKDGGEKPFVVVKDSWKPAGVEFTHTYPKEAPIELTAFPYYETFLGGGSCVGGGGTGAARVSPGLQVITEISGCTVLHQSPYNVSADSLFYGGGFRVTPWAAHKISPFTQFMFGGRKVTLTNVDEALREKLRLEWNDGSGTIPHFATRSDYENENSQNGPSIAVGGGVDVVVTRPFAWRVINVEYTRSWMDDVGPIRPQQGLKISTQAVVRIGTW